MDKATATQLESLPYLPRLMIRSIDSDCSPGTLALPSIEQAVPLVNGDIQLNAEKPVHSDPRRPHVTGVPSRAKSKITKVELMRADALPDSAIRIWKRILASDPTLDHPQLRPEFVLAIHNAGREVEVACLFDQQELVGFFPFVRTSKKWGEPIAGPAADFEALIAYPDLECSISSLLSKCRLKAWKFAHLSAKQNCFSQFHAYYDEAPFLDLTHGYTNYLQTIRARSRSTLTAIERKSRKLEREVGPISFEYRAQDLPQAVELLKNWKQHQLLRQGFDDMFQLPWVSRLIDLCSRHNAESFSGIVSVLKAAEQPVAIHFGLRCERIFLSWIPAYHPDFQNYSAGAQLFLKLAEAAASEGVTRLDLGRGENQLKDSLKSSAYRLAIGTASAHSSTAFVRNGLLKLKQRLRSNPWIYKAWRRVKVSQQSRT